MTIVRNKNRHKTYTLNIKNGITFETFLLKASKKLNIKARRIFLCTGQELFNEEDLYAAFVAEEWLYVSQFEEFLPDQYGYVEHVQILALNILSQISHASSTPISVSRVIELNEHTSLLASVQSDILGTGVDKGLFVAVTEHDHIYLKYPKTAKEHWIDSTNAGLDTVKKIKKRKKKAGLSIPKSQQVSELTASDIFDEEIIAASVPEDLSDSIPFLVSYPPIYNWAYAPPLRIFVPSCHANNRIPAITGEFEFREGFKRTYTTSLVLCNNNFVTVAQPIINRTDEINLTHIHASAPERQKTHRFRSNIAISPTNFCLMLTDPKSIRGLTPEPSQTVILSNIAESTSVTNKIKRTVSTILLLGSVVHQVMSLKIPMAYPFGLKTVESDQADVQPHNNGNPGIDIRINLPPDIAKYEPTFDSEVPYITVKFFSPSEKNNYEYMSMLFLKQIPLFLTPREIEFVLRNVAKNIAPLEIILSELNEPLVVCPERNYEEYSSIKRAKKIIHSQSDSISLQSSGSMTSYIGQFL